LIDEVLSVTTANVRNSEYVLKFFIFKFGNEPAIDNEFGRFPKRNHARLMLIALDGVLKRNAESQAATGAVAVMDIREKPASHKG